jgi:hypothetical protein
VTLLPQKLKNTPLLHFEIPLVVLSLKLIFFFPFQSPRLHCRSHGRISIHLGDSGHSSSSTSPFGSHRSWETVLTSPSGSHRNTPDRRYPSTIITRRKALTRRHLKHISEASRSEYLHRTAPEIIHTMLIPRKPQFFDKTAKKKKKETLHHAQDLDQGNIFETALLTAPDKNATPCYLQIKARHPPKIHDTHRITHRKPPNQHR